MNNGPLICRWTQHLPVDVNHGTLHRPWTTSRAVLALMGARKSPPGPDVRPRDPSRSVVVTTDRGGARGSPPKKQLNKSSKCQPTTGPTGSGSDPRFSLSEVQSTVDRTDRGSLHGPSVSPSVASRSRIGPVSASSG
uniref:Uncharacterized protein n=1 Tax=Solanum tuberosum TaxID=4113 RepID=M1DX80_SOLTU